MSNVVTLKVRTRFSWWFRPAVAIAMALGHLSSMVINAAVDHGVKIDLGPS